MFSDNPQRTHCLYHDNLKSIMVSDYGAWPNVGIVGRWASVTRSDRISKLEIGADRLKPGMLAGMLICPNEGVSPFGVTRIVGNTTNAIYVLGDAFEAKVGGTGRIIDYHRLPKDDRVSQSHLVRSNQTLEVRQVMMPPFSSSSTPTRSI